MIRRGTAFIVMFVFFGVVAAQLKVQLFSVDMKYSAALLRPSLARSPSFAIELRYGAGVLNTILERMRAAREAAVASAVPDSLPKTVQQVPGDTESAAVAPDGKSETTEKSTSEKRVPGQAPSTGTELDFARVAPDGTSVFAGRAPPGSNVIVLENDTPIGSTKAGSDGNWSLATEHRFANADSDINVRAAADTPGDTATPQSVARAAAPLDEGGTATETVPTTPDALGAEGPSPADHLIKEFAKVVEAARQEAKQKDQTVPAAGHSGAMATAVEAVPPPQKADTGPSSTIVVQRAAPATIIPVPMRFNYNEATMTDDGRQAASLLLEYLKLKRFGEVTLSGHADERGGPDFNMSLSRERLDTIVQLLREGGYQGKIQLLPKGESEPFVGVDRTRLALEGLMQLDRRVELRVAR